MDPETKWQHPRNVEWSRKILVPFAPETPKSGINFEGFCEAFWYRRQFTKPEPNGQRLLLHFDAVDYKATVWINGRHACTHEGGYTPFTCDITPLLEEGDVQEIAVLAEDDPADLGKPRGKQDWQLRPHSIWYPRTSGIWRTVWLERVADTYITTVNWTPNRERWEIGMELHVETLRDRELLLELRLSARFHTNDAGAGRTSLFLTGASRWPSGKTVSRRRAARTAAPPPGTIGPSTPGRRCARILSART
jgi:hypothetical protein